MRRLARVSEEDGFLLIEVIAAVVILSIALLALMAGYDSAFLSLHASSQKSAVSSLAEQQLELYRALPYNSIELNATTTANIGDSNNPAYDSTYATNTLLDGDWVPCSDDPNTLCQNPSGTVNDVTGTCASIANVSLDNCAPIQTVTGSDGKSYRLETFIRDRLNQTAISHEERVVTVIVRDPANLSELFRAETAFDEGPPS